MSSTDTDGIYFYGAPLNYPQHGSQRTPVRVQLTSTAEQLPDLGRQQTRQRRLFDPQQQPPMTPIGSEHPSPYRGV